MNEGNLNDLKDMTDTLTAIKGAEYAKLVASMFSMGNILEMLIDMSSQNENSKAELGIACGCILTQLGSSLVWFVAKARGKELTEVFLKEVAEEIGNDIDMLRRKQMEFE